MRISELVLRFDRVELNALTATLCALALVEPDLELTVSETSFTGMVEPMWGTLLGDDADDWAEAQEMSEEGLGSIETVLGPPGRQHLFVFFGPYRQAVLQAFEATGRPQFWHTTSFVRLRLARASRPALELHFDRATGATGFIERRTNESGEPVAILGFEDSFGFDHGLTSTDDYIWAVEMADLVAVHGELHLSDTTGYVESRDATALVAALAMERTIVRGFQAMITTPLAAAAFERSAGRLLDHLGELSSVRLPDADDRG